MGRTMRERIAQMRIDHPERIPALDRAKERLANGEIKIEVEVLWWVDYPGHSIGRHAAFCSQWQGVEQFQETLQGVPELWRHIVSANKVKLISATAFYSNYLETGCADIQYLDGANAFRYWVKVCEACGEGELFPCSEIFKLDYMGKTAYHASCHSECDTCGAYLTDWEQSKYNLAQYQAAKEQVGMP